MSIIKFRKAKDCISQKHEATGKVMLQSKDVSDSLVLSTFLRDIIIGSVSKLLHMYTKKFAQSVVLNNYTYP